MQSPSPAVHDFRSVRIARSLGDRVRGVIGRPAGDLAIFIPNCRSIHTCFVGAAIDAVFLDGDQKIVAIDRNIRPWRVSIGPRTAAGVLELPAGASAQLAVGDSVALALP